MKIADGLVALEIPMNSSGPIMNPVLMWDDNSTILFDTGLPGQLPLFRDEIEKVGVSFEKLNLVIITHQDMDHIGSLGSIQKELGSNLKVVSHTEEKPYIEFEKRPIKMTPERMAQMEADLAKSQQIPLKDMIASLKSKVNVTVEDNDILPYCGGIKVIHTPGHTPGHICLYLVKYKALITGDALNMDEGKLVGPNALYTYDMEKALDSIRKLTEYDIETIICYHGGVYNNNANEAIANLCR